MNGDTNERVADSLRERGFDARAFKDTDERYCQRESGVAIHGVCVLGWRYPDGRWEFIDRPARLIEPDERDPTGRWIWEEILGSSGGRRQLSVTVTDRADVVSARVAELLPVDPERPHSRCFPDLWTWESTGWYSGGAPLRWDEAWRNHLNLPRPRAALDPTKPLTTPVDAVTTAGTLLRKSAVGLGSVIDQAADAGIWEANTEFPLAATLYAASPCGNGKGIGWVLRAVDNLTPGSRDEPGWHSAARYVASQPLFRNALLRTLALDPRQRDSIVMTMRDALSPWMHTGIDR